MPKIRFAVECPGAKTVHLAGDFNQWQGRRMRRARHAGGPPAQRPTGVFPAGSR